MTTPGPAFSNGFEYDMWRANWCERCTHDAAFQRGESDEGCPLLLTALLGDIPAEWMEQPVGEEGPSLTDRYHCINFRGPDDPDYEPKPQPEPPDMDGLFERPGRAVRMLVQPQPADVAVGGGS